MTLPSTLFLVLLSPILVFGHLYPTDQKTRGPGKGEPMERGKPLTRNRDRQQRSVGSQQNPNAKLKILDFSADIDNEPDANGEYTGATLEAGSLSPCAWHLWRTLGPLSL